MSNPEQDRLVSLDALRGITIASMILVNNPGSWAHIYAQLDHAEWNGWTFTDLIFPFFLFIVGVSIVLALSRGAGRPRKEVYAKIARRALVIFALGLFLNGFPDYDLSMIRVMGVLQRIAVCYLLAAIAYRELSLAGLAALSTALCLVYWALMSWYPTPGIGPGVWEKGRNFAAYVDQLVLGKHCWPAVKTWDPEGIVSTLPALANTLFGVMAGLWIKAGRSRGITAKGLVVAGALGLAAGWLWGLVLPINKNIWTPSYAVFMSGFALLVWSAVYWLIEIRGKKAWAYPFVVYGANSIAVFVFSGLVARLLNLWKVMGPTGKMTAVKNWIYLKLFSSWLSPFNASLAYALVFIAFTYAVMWALYKKRIFLKA